MAIPIVPHGMGYFASAKSASHYTEWSSAMHSLRRQSKRVHRPTNLRWIRKNSRMKKIIGY